MGGGCSGREDATAEVKLIGETGGENTPQWSDSKYPSVWSKGGLDTKVKPSNPYNIDAKPSGTVTKITDKMDKATRRALTRMTPEEAVRLAAKTVGGKSGEAFVPPTSGIVYGKFGKDGLQGSGKEKRIFGDIALKDVVEKAKSRPVQIKEVEFQIDRTRSEEREVHDDDPIVEYSTGRNRYRMRESEARRIERMVESELAEWVEGQERAMPEEEYLKLLYKYREYLERKA